MKEVIIMKDISMFNCAKNGFKSAIVALDQFTKNWCVDIDETERTNELTFRCKYCPFYTGEKICRVKELAYHLNPDFTRELDFGAMGLL